MAAVEAARTAHWGAIVSARSGETDDVTIVHLAVGWGVLHSQICHCALCWKTISFHTNPTKSPAWVRR
jgi:enolase